MKKIFLLIGLAVFLSGCHQLKMHNHDEVVHGHPKTCYVRDHTGRTWHWRSSHHACAKALHRCRASHHAPPFASGYQSCFVVQ